jgi:hypothetical protein
MRTQWISLHEPPYARVVHACAGEGVLGKHDGSRKPDYQTDQMCPIHCFAPICFSLLERCYLGICPGTGGWCGCTASGWPYDICGWAVPGGPITEYGSPRIADKNLPSLLCSANHALMEPGQSLLMSHPRNDWLNEHLFIPFLAAAIQ